MGSSANHQPMPPTDEALVGTILDHQYQLTAVLGKGGQACVYKAMSVHLQEPVAVKVWHREFASDPGKLEKFREEARIAARLEHRNIARIRAMGVDGIHAYLVMEYMAGTSLEMALQKDGPMQPADFLNVFRQVCNGLRFAHEQQILHRDLKPSNIIIAAIPIARTEATYLNQIRDYNGAVLQLKKALKSLDSSALTQTDPAMVAHTRASLLQGLAEMRNNQGNLTGAIQASRASLAIPTGTLDERGYKCGWLAEIADRAANTKTFDYAMKLHRQLCGKSSNGSCGPNTADCFYYAAEQLFLRKKLRRSLQLAEVANAEYSHLASPQPKHVYCLTLLAALQIHYKNYEAANAYLKQTQSLNSKASADLIQEQQALWKILKKVKRL